MPTDEIRCMDCKADYVRQPGDLKTWRFAEQDHLTDDQKAARCRGWYPVLGLHAAGLWICPRCLTFMCLGDQSGSQVRV